MALLHVIIVCSDMSESHEANACSSSIYYYEHLTVVIGLWHYNHVSHDQVLPFLN